MREHYLRIMTELCCLEGPPSREGAVIARLRDLITPLADRVEIDDFGNLYAYRDGPEGAPTLMLAGHSDEVGFVVTRVESNGFLRFERVGNPNPLTCQARRVRVNGVEGVIGARSWHLMTDEERRVRSVPDWPNCYIDVGASSAAEVKALGIRPGSMVTFVGEMVRLGSGDRYLCKSWDDRLGCALILFLFEALVENPPPVNVVGVMTVQEEVGLRGAAMAGYTVNPDWCLALDNDVTQDTPDCPVPAEDTPRVGGGPVVHVLEASPVDGAGMIAHPAFFDFIMRVAESNGIPAQVGFLRGRTDGSPIHLSRGGVPTVYLGSPSRYAHSPSEIVDLGDLENTAALVKAVVQSLTPDTRFRLVD